MTASTQSVASDAQKEAGNYRMIHRRVAGLAITIENPAGSLRSGTAPDGKEWSIRMRNHYGRIKGSVGADSDHVDCFIKTGLSPETVVDQVHVVNQRDPSTHKFDEHKVMIGWGSVNAARKAYYDNYERGWTGLASIVTMPIDDFKAWLKDEKATKKVVKKTAAESFEKVLYHGSSRKHDVLEPRDEHGDPGIPPAVFATPHLQMALAYLGRKWGDKDIAQGGLSHDDFYLSEMRPGALDDTFKGTSGYLHTVPSDTFKKREGNGSDWEEISTDPVKPVQVRRLRNLLKELETSGVRLLPYDPKSRETRESISFSVKRMLKMTPEEREGYLQWRLGPGTPDEIREQFLAELAKYPELAPAGEKKTAGEFLHPDTKLVRSILDNQGFPPDDQIKDTDDLVKDLGADELDLVEILMQLEKSTGIPIPDSALSTKWTPASLAAYLQARKDPGDTPSKTAYGLLQTSAVDPRKTASEHFQAVIKAAADPDQGLPTTVGEPLGGPHPVSKTRPVTRKEIWDRVAPGRFPKLWDASAKHRESWPAPWTRSVYTPVPGTKPVNAVLSTTEDFAKDFRITGMGYGEARDRAEIEQGTYRPPSILPIENKPVHLREPQVRVKREAPLRVLGHEMMHQTSPQFNTDKWNTALDEYEKGGLDRDFNISMFMNNLHLLPPGQPEDKVEDQESLSRLFDLTNRLYPAAGNRQPQEMATQLGTVRMHLESMGVDTTDPDTLHDALNNLGRYGKYQDKAGTVYENAEIQKLDKILNDESPVIRKRLIDVLMQALPGIVKNPTDSARDIGKTASEHFQAVIKAAADTHGEEEGGWVGIDLDGTLAVYNGWKGATVIGDPIPAMVDRVKAGLDAGKDIRILTARVSGDKGDDAEAARKAIKTWCKEHLGKVLPITDKKDPKMLELWDDRVVQVEPNTGKKVAGSCSTELEKTASEHFQAVVKTSAAYSGKSRSKLQDMANQLTKSMSGAERNVPKPPPPPVNFDPERRLPWFTGEVTGREIATAAKSPTGFRSITPRQAFTEEYKSPVLPPDKTQAYAPNLAQARDYRKSNPGVNYFMSLGDQRLDETIPLSVLPKNLRYEGAYDFVEDKVGVTPSSSPFTVGHELGHATQFPEQRHPQPELARLWEVFKRSRKGLARMDYLSAASATTYSKGSLDYLLNPVEMEARFRSLRPMAAGYIDFTDPVETTKLLRGLVDPRVPLPESPGLLRWFYTHKDFVNVLRQLPPSEKEKVIRDWGKKLPGLAANDAPGEPTRKTASEHFRSVLSRG